MNITVNVDSVDLTSVVGGKTVHYDEETGDYITEDQTLADLVSEQIVRRITKDDEWPHLRTRVTDIRDEEIRSRVAPAVEAVMAEPIRKTNTYGEATGASTTMRELILDEAKKYMEKPADQYSRNGGTVLQKWVREEVEKTIKTELAAVLADEKAKVVAAVRAQASTLIAEAVKRGLGG